MLLPALSFVAGLYALLQLLQFTTESFEHTPTPERQPSQRLWAAFKSLHLVQAFATLSWAVQHLYAAAVAPVSPATSALWVCVLVAEVLLFVAARRLRTACIAAALRARNGQKLAHAYSDAATDPNAQGGLVTDGPYAHVRHPIYASYALFYAGFYMFGAVLLWERGFAAAPAVATATQAVAALHFTRFLVGSICAEEAAMRTSDAGDEYAKYCGRVRSRVVPFIY